MGRWPVVVRAMREQPVIVWDKGGSNDKVKEEVDIF